LHIIPIHEKVVGIQVNKKYKKCCFLRLDGNGEYFLEFQKFLSFANTLKELIDWTKEMDPQVVLIEETWNFWQSTAFYLRQAGFKVASIHPSSIKNMEGKTSVDPSQWIATIALFGMYTPNY
jgi:transposase